MNDDSVKEVICHRKKKRKDNWYRMMETFLSTISLEIKLCST